MTIHCDSDQPCLVTDTEHLDNWKRLAELLEQRRVALGYPKRQPFAKAHGLSHDRTLSDLENARRTNYDSATLAQVEQIYRWVSGSIAAVLQGGAPVVLPESVGPNSDDPSVLGSLPPEALEGLGTAERAEVIAAAHLRALEKAREIRRRLNDEV